MNNSQRRNSLILPIGIGASIALVSLVHFQTVDAHPLMHEVTQRLYYLPIVFAAYRYGLKGGVSFALLSIALFVPHLDLHSHEPEVYHNQTRSGHSFVAINCAAIPEGLLESEFFGHKKGSFTGATADAKGKIEAANGGTVFLDEIGDLPLAMQAKLLRVLQDGEFFRIGDTVPRRADVRIIAAANRDLPRMTEDKTFREDLYFRLNIVPIKLPPLRERREDIPLLADHFLGKRALLARQVRSRWFGGNRNESTNRSTLCRFDERDHGRWKSTGVCTGRSGRSAKRSASACRASPGG